jgi:hypothetical protein
MKDLMKYIVLPLACALLLLGLSVTLVLPRGPINQENFKKITLGMTQKEIEDIIGPAGDYSTHPPAFELDDVCLLMLDGDSITGVEWASDEAVISISFDSAGRLERKSILVPMPETFLEKLRRYSERLLLSKSS